MEMRIKGESVKLSTWAAITVKTLNCGRVAEADICLVNNGSY